MEEHDIDGKTPLKSKEQAKAYSHSTMETQVDLLPQKEEQSLEEIEEVQKPDENLSCRAIIVLLTSITFWSGSMCSFDFPEIYEKFLMEYFSIDSVKVEYMYSFIYVPNIFLGFLGSYLMNKFGCANLLIYLHCIIGLGLISQFYGVSVNNYVFMLIGRAIIGIGFEVTYVCQSEITDIWFSGKFLSVAYALNRSFAYIFTTTGSLFIPNLFLSKMESAEKQGLSKESSLRRGFLWVLSCYLAMVVYVFICCLIYKIIEERQEKEQSQKEKENENQIESQVQSKSINSQEEYNKRRSTSSFKYDEESGKLSQFEFKDFTKVPKIGWILSVFFMFIANCFYMFTTFGTEILQFRYGFSYEKSKNTVSIFPIVCMFAVPLFSYLASKIGKKGIFLIVASLLCVGNFFWMSTISKGDGVLPIVGVVNVALFLSINTAGFWSGITICVPRQSLAFMIGALIGLQNVLGVILPPIFGWIQNNDDYEGFQNSLYFLTGLGCVPLILSIIIYKLDMKQGQGLNLPENHPSIPVFRKKLIEDFEKAKLQDKKISNEYIKQ